MVQPCAAFHSSKVIPDSYGQLQRQASHQPAVEDIMYYPDMVAQQKYFPHKKNQPAFESTPQIYHEESIDMRCQPVENNDKEKSLDW